MGIQSIEFSFDKDAAWNKVVGRHSAFLDTNCWIDMADEANDTACRVRDKLKGLVSSGCVFCPLSWGLLEELFKQAGASLERTACLMEELSMNVIYVIRPELYKWELARSVQRACGEPVSPLLNGLFAPVGAFLGSQFSIKWSADVPLTQEVQDDVRAFMKRDLDNISVTELVKTAGGSLREKPTAYSQGAKYARDTFKGDKQRLFLEEAGNIFRTWVTPILLQYPPHVVLQWMKYYGRPEGENAFFRDCLADFPALHNYIEIMVTADMQPDRKDKHNDFLDYEIMVVPLAYATAFVSRDKGIRDLLRHRTNMLSRTTCQYCDSLDALETWLAGKGA